jgi:predicted amidophosphoribosyltransferase
VDSATIIPMPLAPDRYRERGFNQSTLIARATLEQIDVTPIGCNENAVIRASSAPQTRLGTRAEREQNVSGVFTLARPETIEDRHVIILDDIVTTGASMNALAACIAAGRPRSLLCVAVAHTPLGRDRHV